MGVSLQQYRIAVQTFNQSNIFSYRSLKPKCKKCGGMKATNHLKFLSMLILFLCSVTACWDSSDLELKTKSQSSHFKLVYPASHCSNLELVEAEDHLHLPEEGADRQYPGGQVQQLRLDGSNLRSTSKVKFRSCILLTKSLVIDDYNFLARYKYGNRRGAGIKLCHWNKGSAFLINSMNEIEATIAEYKLHILGISESNFHSHHRIEDVQIENYNLYLADTLNNPNLNVSRVAVYVHKDIVVKERRDLMTDNFSSVWLEVGLRRQKKFLVANIYRDWKYQGQGNRESGTIAAQLSRWESFLQKWELAIAAGNEIHVMGDTNLDYLDFHKDVHQVQDHAARLRPLTHALQDLAVPNGFLQLIPNATGIWSGQEPSLLDHHWTNKPEKITNVHTFYQGASDHKLIFSIRHTKASISKPRLIRKRCFKDFDPGKFIEAVQKITWLEVYLTEDVDIAVEIVTKKLTEILDMLAPVKTLQTRTNYAPWLSGATKEKIKQRNEAQIKAARTKKQSDWKNIRNRGTGLIIL